MLSSASPYSSGIQPGVREDVLRVREIKKKH